MVLIAVLIIFALLGYFLIVQNGFYGFKKSKDTAQKISSLETQAKISNTPKDKGIKQRPELLAVRRTAGDTTSNTNTICEIINGNKGRIVFFATASKFDGENTDNAGEYIEANLPLMAALIEFDVPHFGKQYIVLDGLFLTARRHPRYIEIKAVLDAAEACDNCYFSKIPAPFTASKSAPEAAAILSSLGDVQPLNAGSRHVYFSFLSPFLTEKQHQEI